MAIKKEFVTGFWIGAALISLVNLILIVLSKNQYSFDGYIFIIATIILLFFLAIKIHLLKPRRR